MAQRFSVLVAALVLVGVSCGGDDGETAAEPAATASPTTEAPAPETTAAPPTTVAPTTEAPTTVAPTTEAPTTTVDPVAADVALIKALWRAYSDSWNNGPASGAQFIAENNYPGFYNDPAELLACQPLLERDEAIVDADSIEPDPSWVMNDGPLAGQALAGTIYILAADFVVTWDGVLQAPTKAEVHSAILDGRANFFVGCP